jgi:DNA polymerase III subunit epsilon
MFGIIKERMHKTAAADLATQLSDARFVVVDTELTGLDEKQDCIVSIGALRMAGGTIDIGNTFYQLANPEKALSACSVVIHEITPSEVAEKPPIDMVLKEFLQFIGSDILIGHFISIDKAFLDREVKRICGHKINNRVLDTCSIYEWLARRLKDRDCFATKVDGYRLYDIVKCFSIPVSCAHNAMMDAYTTALLFQRFLPMLAETGIETIGDLLEIGRPFKGGDHFRGNSEFSNF